MSSITLHNPSDTLIPINEFNFADGDICFSCETSVFKVHSDFLRVDLPKLLTVKPRTPNWEGCPLVPLPHNSVLFVSLLRLVYNGFTDNLLNTTRSEFEHLLSLCQLAGSYASEPLRSRLFKCLWFHLPAHSMGRRDCSLDSRSLQAIAYLAIEFRHRELFARVCYEIGIKGLQGMVTTKQTEIQDRVIRRSVRAGHKHLFQVFEAFLRLTPPLPSCHSTVPTSYKPSKGGRRGSTRIQTRKNQCWVNMSRVFDKLQANSSFHRGRPRFINPIKRLAEESAQCHAEAKLCPSCTNILMTYLTHQAFELEYYLFRHFKL